MDYNPYSAVSAIYNLKGEWDNANRAGNTNKKNDAAAKAQKFYQELRKNGCDSVANELSASDYTQAKNILDRYANTSSSVTTSRPNVSSGVDNPAYSQSMSVASNKNDEYWSTIKSDHSNVNSKYDSVFNYANSDITQTDEYKSAFKNIMPSYNLAALQGRDNEVASGAASNGGNIDSFSAANALRQQAALTAKGQALAHQMGLEAYQARVNSARDILSGLGAYNQGVYSAMSDSINHDRSIANDYFNNAETAKNNDVARKSEIASVTGTVPTEWVLSNNPFMNSDGTIKKEYDNDNIDFSVIMENAKANGNTNLYNAAATARFYKIMNDYGKYGQYDDGNYNVPSAQKTQPAYEFDEKIKQANEALAGEISMNAANNQNTLDQITTAAMYSPATPTMTLAQATSAIKSGELSDAALAVYNTEHHTAYTKENPPPIYKPANDLSTNMKIFIKKVNDIVANAGYTAPFNSDGTRKNDSTIWDEKIINMLLEDTSLTDDEKEQLIEHLGISPGVVDTVTNEGHYKSSRAE